VLTDSSCFFYFPKTLHFMNSLQTWVRQVSLLSPLFSHFLLFHFSRISFYISNDIGFFRIKIKIIIHSWCFQQVLAANHTLSCSTFWQSQICKHTTISYLDGGEMWRGRGRERQRERERERDREWVSFQLEAAQIWLMRVLLGINELNKGRNTDRA
jgi:hypothetical protein